MLCFAKKCFEPVDPTEPKAVFMTASEIHAKLKMWGNITNPMPLNKFGELLKRSGYEKKCLCNGRKGFVVRQIDNQEFRHHEQIQELLHTDSTDSTF